MDPSFERRVMEVFDEVVGWPPKDREAELARRFANAPDLVAAVRQLIAAHARADLLPTEPPEPVAALDIAPPERVGAYRLAEEIGRGGMGVVYRGERTEGGFEQTVAIKLMRGGLFSQAAAEQFALERRILARLRHPHITQLFDGGQTRDGLAYIVMERVTGLPITEHAAAARSTLKERVALFLTVCEAVEHAHANGVIHGDIKPNNVVVDRSVGVKVLDFGIAALVDAAETRTVGTTRPRAATVRYASPQQRASEPAGPSDDVFALGVLLEDLATGGGVDADLAAVIGRATDAKRETRYAQVRDLAADVERWLGRYPVQARAAGPAHAGVLLARRHPMGVSAAAAAVAGLILALAVTTTLYLRAERRLQEVRGLSAYLFNDVTQALLQSPGTAQLRHDVADRGRAYLEALDVPGSRPDIRMEVAEGYARMGEALTQVGGSAVGDIANGKADLARAEAELRGLLAEHKGGDAAELVLVRTLNARAAVLQNIDNDAPAARRLYAEACRRADGLIQRTPQDPAPRLANLQCLTGRANLMNYEGQFAAMPPVLAQAIAGYRSLPAGADKEVVALGLARAYNLLGDARYYLGSPPDALATYRESAAVLEAARARRRDVRALDGLVVTRFNIASTLKELGRPREQLAEVERGLQVSALLNAFEDNPRARHLDNIMRMQRAVALSDNGRHDEAIAEALAGIGARRAVARSRPEDYDAARTVAVGLKPLGEIYDAAGDRRNACAAYEEARRTWRALQHATRLNGFDGGPELKEIEAKVAACEA